MAINNPVISDSDILQGIAVAIQAKDGGGKMYDTEMRGRIENIPSGGTLIQKTITENGVYNASSDNVDGYDVVTVDVGNFDMTVTDNQVKMIIEINDNDLSLWTRFGQTAQSTVTVAWGDGTSDSYNEALSKSIEYATQRKHNYSSAGKYLVVISTENDSALTIGGFGAYSTLSEGELGDNERINTNDTVKRYYNSKIKELAFGNNVNVSGGFVHIPWLVLHNSIDTSIISMQQTGISNNIVIKNGVTTVKDYCFNGTTAYKIIFPSSIVSILSEAFNSAAIKILDFTNISLDENGNFPVVLANTNVFRSTNNGMIFLFKTKEIADVVKTSTNWSNFAARIKYEGGI